MRPGCESESLFALICAAGDEDGLERCGRGYGFDLFEYLDGEFACWSSSDVSSRSFRKHESCIASKFFTHASCNAGLYTEDSQTRVWVLLT